MHTINPYGTLYPMKSFSDAVLVILFISMNPWVVGIGKRDLWQNTTKREMNTLMFCKSINEAS